MDVSPPGLTPETAHATRVQPTIKPDVLRLLRKRVLNTLRKAEVEERHGVDQMESTGAAARQLWAKNVQKQWRARALALLGIKKQEKKDNPHATRQQDRRRRSTPRNRRRKSSMKV